MLPRADPRQALARLREAAASETLDPICERYRVTVLVAFGSATLEDEPEPRDLDLAACFEEGTSPDVIMLMDELYHLCRPVELDLVNLNGAPPVLRAIALGEGVPLYERKRGDYARAQIAAVLERLDTAWLRRLDLDLMAK